VEQAGRSGRRRGLTDREGSRSGGMPRGGGTPMEQPSGEFIDGGGDVVIEL
jgi:hypothetical protein